MFRSYIGYAMVALALYGYAQSKGWSLFASEAQEFASRRAQRPSIALPAARAAAAVAAVFQASKFTRSQEIPMIEYLKPAALVGTLVYSLIGVIIMFVSFIVIDKITPYDLWKELCENRNQPIATVAAAFLIAIAIIVAAAIHS